MTENRGGSRRLADGPGSISGARSLNPPSPPPWCRPSRAALDVAILSAVPCTLDDVLERFPRIARREVHGPIKLLAHNGHFVLKNIDGRTHLLEARR